MTEIVGLGGASFEDALQRFRAGEAVDYRGMHLVLRRAEFECRVPAEGLAEGEAITDKRALDALTKARFRLGSLLASAPPLEAIVGNREPRLILVRERAGGATEDLFELRGDRLRRMRDQK
jgi:hypothetical protein